MFKNEGRRGEDDGEERTETLVVKELERKHLTTLNKFQVSRFKSNPQPMQRVPATVSYQHGMWKMEKYLKIGNEQLLNLFSETE